MKAYRKAFFILARRRKTVVRRIGLPYLLSATSAALLAVGGVSNLQVFCTDRGAALATCAGYHSFERDRN